METQQTSIEHKKETLMRNKRSQQGSDDQQQGLEKYVKHWFAKKHSKEVPMNPNKTQQESVDEHQQSTINRD